jgi:hypothetical protein
MALSMTVSKMIDGFDAPAVASDAYWRITEIKGNKDGMDVVVMAFKNGKAVSMHTSSFVVDVAGENFIRQAYLHLKTLPEFANAVDC